MRGEPVWTPSGPAAETKGHPRSTRLPGLAEEPWSCLALVHHCPGVPGRVFSPESAPFVTNDPHACTSNSPFPRILVGHTELPRVFATCRCGGVQRGDAHLHLLMRLPPGRLAPISLAQRRPLQPSPWCRMKPLLGDHVAQGSVFHIHDEMQISMFMGDQ